MEPAVLTVRLTKRESEDCTGEGWYAESEFTLSLHDVSVTYVIMDLAVGCRKIGVKKNSY